MTTQTKARSPLCAGHRAPDGTTTFVASTEDDVRAMAVHELENALYRAADRWGDAKEEFALACWTPARRASAPEASTRLIAAQANYMALSKQVFRVLNAAVQDAQVEVPS